MGNGWQSVIRLAALEALSEYPQLVKDRVVLLLEEPETHLHPHLCRKIRRLLTDLAAKGWTVVYTTHAADLVSFEVRQNITRMVRSEGTVSTKSVDTGNVDRSAKLQSKLDERGSHDFLFSTRVILCEGRDYTFATRLALENVGRLRRPVDKCDSVRKQQRYSSVCRNCFGTRDPLVRLNGRRSPGRRDDQPEYRETPSPD